MELVARVATAHAARYLSQLCKHFGHKVPATLGEGVGRVQFPAGVLDGAAEPDVLVLRVTAADPAEVERLCGVVARHLERFAFREAPSIQWAAD
jgi:hypothetical protein